MSIDFSLSPELEEIRARTRAFVDEVVKPTEQKIHDERLQETDREAYLGALIEMRKQAREAGIWLPHMPEEWGGMGLGHVAAGDGPGRGGQVDVRAVGASTARRPTRATCTRCCTGGPTSRRSSTCGRCARARAWSCFAMTEPEVAGSDPTLIQTRGYQDGEEWVINGHKWFISNAHRANFAILIARTEDDPDLPQAANTAFLVDLPAEGWTEVRQIETMHGGTGHSEIRIEDLRVHESKMLGGRGQGHLLGQYRLGPARLAHCMRWIAQAEMALDMMVDRSLNRFAHGSLLAEKQGIQWMIADSTMELYQAKLMVLHAAYKIDRGEDFKSEVSMAKHFVANMLNRVIDRSIQVHGALGLLDRHAAGPHVPARPLGPLRRRCRRGPPDAHRPAHDRRLQGHRLHPHAPTGDLPI